MTEASGHEPSEKVGAVSVAAAGSGWRAHLRACGEAWRSRWSALGANQDVVLAAVVAAATLALLLATARQGFVRDEGYYFRAAREYHLWFEELWSNLWSGRLLDSFTDAALTRAFGYNTEHPGFVKLFMGWTWKIFHGWLGWTSNATGYRLAPMIIVAAGNGFTFLLGARWMSRGAGLLGVALLMLCPRVFFHAHLAAFDGPIMAMTVITTYAFWRSLTSWPWLLGAGLAWGVAIATKHNAVFLLPTFALAYLLARASDLRLERGGRLRLPPVPLALVAMVLIGPLALYFFYPYGWHHPIHRIGAYYLYHLHHESYPVDYFGTLYLRPPFPFGFPWVMSALTIPLTTLVPGVVALLLWGFAGLQGSWRSLRDGVLPMRPAINTWLMVLSTVVPPFIIALPAIPIFGGTKHWMTAMPFFCLLAAWLLVRAAGDLRGALPRAGGHVAAGMLAAAVLLPAMETTRAYPLGNTYFNELAGGTQGGAALGMPRTFWGGDGRGLLPVLDERAERGAVVFTDRMNLDDFRAYQRDGLLRADLRFTTAVRRASWAIINHQREYRINEERIWSLTGSRKPEAVVARDGVAIASLYHVVPAPARPVTGPGSLGAADDGRKIPRNLLGGRERP